MDFEKHSDFSGWLTSAAAGAAGRGSSLGKTLAQTR